MRLLVLLGLAGSLVAGPAWSQDPAAPDLLQARTAIDRWFGLVRQGAADQTWGEASEVFRARIRESEWREWVRRTAGQLPLGTRRDLEFTVGHDEPPLASLHWVRAVVASDRPAGGRVIEQIVLWYEGSRWRVTHYASWMDHGAMLASGAVNPVPYEVPFAGQHTLRDQFPWWVPGLASRPHRLPRPSPGPPEQPANRANPKTFTRP
ncbi:MAG: DUF4019 domain-containing protein [Gemmatimonadetes bacterium]|nr:DUF4019 domain-containing protein [Gemmatimonadota bacterium]